MGSHSEKESPYAFLAMLALYDHFRGSDEVETRPFKQICKDLYPEVELLDEKATMSLFISWKKKREGAHLGHAEYALRGCIGTFAKLPIIEGIKKYSLIAAFEDSRFPDIEEKELPRLSCTCNILHNFTTIYNNKKNLNMGDINNWVIGEHGIELKYRDPVSNSILSATFLPEVMKEQGWDKETTFEYLIEKAGCLSNISTVLTNYKKYFIEVIRYEGMESTIYYEGFKSKLDRLEVVKD